MKIYQKEIMIDFNIFYLILLLLKNLELDKNYNGSFQFKSSGFQKNYDTNKYESLLINDFLFKSNDYINKKGFKTNYDFLIKNFNSYTENSTSYKNKEDYEVFGAFLIKTSLPLKKLMIMEMTILNQLQVLDTVPTIQKIFQIKI